MKFKFSCPSCSQHISTTTEYVGGRGTCPHCSKEFEVPGPDAPPAGSKEEAPRSGPPPLLTSNAGKSANPPPQPPQPPGTAGKPDTLQQSLEKAQAAKDKPVEDDETLPACNTCGQGVLEKKKKYRLSTPVVILGYLFLIPSVIGVLLGAVLFWATGSEGSKVAGDADRQVRAQLEAKAIPEPIIKTVLAMKPVSVDDNATITTDQRSAEEKARIFLAAHKVGTGIGIALSGGVAIAMIVASITGSLLGWLLVMKKKVLQCTHCDAVVAAS